jgi:signal peptidase II
MNEECPTIFHQRTKVSWALIATGLLVLFFDQISKLLVTSYLPVIDAYDYWYPYGGIGVFHHFAGIEFSINHMTNTGAAWGVLANYQLPLLIMRIGLILALLIYLFYFNRHFRWQFPFILIIAGATGNVIDYFVYGHVIDMFHFVLWGYDFPVFNVADSAISVGIGLLFIISLFEK